MSTHMRVHRVYHTSSIRDGLIMIYLSLVTTKLSATSIITSIVTRVVILIIHTLTFVSLTLYLHLSQSIAYILRYIQPLVLFKMIQCMNFNHLSIDACNFLFVSMMSIRIPRSTSSSSSFTTSTTSFPTSTSTAS